MFCCRVVAITANEVDDDSSSSSASKTSRAAASSVATRAEISPMFHYNASPSSFLGLPHHHHHHLLVFRRDSPLVIRLLLLLNLLWALWSAAVTSSAGWPTICFVALFNSPVFLWQTCAAAQKTPSPRLACHLTFPERSTRFLLCNRPGPSSSPNQPISHPRNHAIQSAPTTYAKRAHKEPKHRLLLCRSCCCFRRALLETLTVVRGCGWMDGGDNVRAGPSERKTNNTLPNSIATE